MRCELAIWLKKKGRGTGLGGRTTIVNDEDPMLDVRRAFAPSGLPLLPLVRQSSCPRSPSARRPVLMLRRSPVVDGMRLGCELEVAAMACRRTGGGRRGVGAGDGDGDLFPRWEPKVGETNKRK